VYFNVGQLADGRHDVTAARQAVKSPFCMLQLLTFFYKRTKHFQIPTVSCPYGNTVN